MTTTPHAELLTNVELDALDEFSLHWGAPRQRDSVRAYGRAIERALLARLGEQQPICWANPALARPNDPDEAGGWTACVSSSSNATFRMPLYTHPAAQPAGDAESLRTELRLKEETHLAVVRRLQAEIDQLRRLKAQAENHERSAALEAFERYETEQREADRLHTQCGGNDGPY